MDNDFEILSTLSVLEKDRESGLGDHGVRKYDHLIGRFNSIDPLWGKYLGWTPYMYSANSPIHLVDLDGNIVVYAQYELRGAATLVGGATSFGIMFDGYTVSLYNTWSIGVGIGLGAGLGLDVGGSFARNVEEMYGHGSAIGAWVAFKFAGGGIEGNLTDPDDRSGSLGFDVNPFVGIGLGLGAYWERSFTIPIGETNLDKIEDAIEIFFEKAENEGVELKLTPVELRKRLLEEYDIRNSSNEESAFELYETSPSSSASGISR